MKNSTLRWLKGCLSAFISGASGAVTSGGVTAVIDPDKFNPMTQTAHFFELSMATGLVVGTVHLAQYLQAHPVPDDDTQLVSKPASTDAQQK